MRLKSWATLIAGALITALAGSLTACTGPDDGPTASPTITTAPSPTPTPTPTPTVDRDIAAAEAAILDAYRGYWAAKVAILKDPAVEPGGELEMYAVDTAVTDVYSTVLTYRANRVVMVGEPALAPQVADVVLPAGTVEGTASITDCVDVTNWQPTNRDTGDSAAAPGQATRVLTNSTAYFYEGRWTIRTSVVDREASC